MIPLSSLLFLVFGFASAQLLGQDRPVPYLATTGGTLSFYLLTFIGFLASLRGGRPATAARRRFWIITIATVLLVVLAGWRQAVQRTDTILQIHDGAVQTEVAADFLLHGTNPYAADFTPTLFGQFPSPYHPDAVNVAWTHYAYPPAIMLMAIPAVALRPWLGPLSDTRWLYLGALIALTAAVTMQLGSWERRSLAVVLLLGNPFLWLYAVAGFNDIITVAAMVASAVLIERRHGRLGGIFMGIALAAKQTAWLALPLWIYWVITRKKSGRTTQDSRKTIAAMALTVGGIICPFFFWNPVAFYDDVVRYVSGAIPFTYPISGSTFLQILHLFGFVDSPWDIIPVWPIQLTAALLTGWIGWRWLRRQPTAATWIAATTMMTLVVAMVSRFFNDNYLSAIVALGTAAYLLHYETERDA